MIKVIIIEDEPNAAKKLERTLGRLDEPLEILGVLESVDTATEWFRHNQADLIFCDIHLGDARSFEIFNKVEVKTPVIFTTAYDEYAIKAFEVNSIDYILKPIRLEDLQKAMTKFHERSETGAIAIDVVLNRLNPPENIKYKKRFMVQFGEEIRTVPDNEIAYFFSEGKYLYIITHNEDEYLIDGTLDTVMDRIDPEKFFKISRQFIVSLEAIHKMYSFPKGRVKVILKPKGKEATISIEKSPQFKKWLNQ